MSKFILIAGPCVIENEKNVMTIAKTIKGKGISYMENQVGWHGKAPNDEQYEQAIKEMRQ